MNTGKLIFPQVLDFIHSLIMVAIGIFCREVRTTSGKLAGLCAYIRLIDSAMVH